MKKAIVLFFLTCLCLNALPSYLWAQSLQITGKIVSKTSGNPVPNASVRLQGTDVGTITDLGGNFTIKAHKGDVLIISSINAETLQFKIGDDAKPIIGLAEKTGNLEDVIVVGYGTQKKSLVTGSISSVKSEDMENMGVTRVDDALGGRVSGVDVASQGGQPGASPVVLIRGFTSINGSTPLYVVDGSIVDQGGISYLNPGDIESVEVLKDAASAAIYGTHGAAGVILITTKKGKAGAARVAYNGSIGTQAPAHKLSLVNATQYATLRNESSLAAGNAILWSNPQSLGAGTNWQNTIFNNSALVTQHDLSVSGGNDKSTYYTSFGIYDDQGIVATSISDYKRFTARLNSSTKIRPWLTAGENIGFSYENTKGSLNTNSEFGGPLSSAINLDPTSAITVPAGSPILNNYPYDSGFVPIAPNGLPYLADTIVTQEITNPLAYIATQQGNYSWADNVVGNVYVAVRPIKGLELKSTFNIKQAFYGNQSFNPIYYLNSSTNNTTSNDFYRENDQTQIWNWDNTISYTRSLGEHHFYVLFGSSAEKVTGSGVNSTLYNLPVDSYSQASFNFNLPTADHLGGGFEDQVYTLSSLLGRFTYDYGEKYLLTANFRRDGSTNFGPNNKYGNFPSISLGWVPTKEDFWKNSSTINFLKIRGGYGVNGNDVLSPFQYESTVSAGRNYPFGAGGTVESGSTPNAPANPDLKWEQTSQLDGGFDITFLKHFTGSFDYFDKKTTGMLLQIVIPGYVGAGGEPTGNVASLKDNGEELELGYNNRIGKVGFSISGNVTHVTNDVTNTGPTAYFTTASFQSSAYEVGRIEVGHPVDAFYGFKTQGIFQTQAAVNNYVNKAGGLIQPNAAPGDFKYADLTGDAQLSANDRTFIGNPSPTWLYGFRINATYQSFDLSIFAQGVSGNQIFQGYRRLDIPNANYMSAALGRWTGPNTSNSYPRLDDKDPNGDFTNPSNFYLHSGAYLRLKNVQIGYTLPHNLSDHMGLQRVRVYVSGDNVFTFTKYNGFDPEVGGNTAFASGNANNFGVDNGIYPTPRTFRVGLNVGF